MAGILSEEERIKWANTSYFRHKKRGVIGQRLSGPGRKDILIYFKDRKKATWVKVDSVEPIEEE